MMRKYFCYLDDGQYTHKIAVPAKNEKEARKFCEGNGEVVAVKDVTDEIQILPATVWTALREAGFNEHECDFVTRSLDF